MPLATQVFTKNFVNAGFLAISLGPKFSIAVTLVTLLLDLCVDRILVALHAGLTDSGTGFTRLQEAGRLEVVAGSWKGNPCRNVQRSGFDISSKAVCAIIHLGCKGSALSQD